MGIDAMQRAGRSISRRGFLGATAFVGTAAFLGGPAFAAGAVRFGSFGSADKLQLRGLALAKFNQLFPQSPVDFEGVPSAAWPDKIAAMIAGGNAPDVITLSNESLVQYGSRKALEPLEPYIPDVINAGLFSPAGLGVGKVGGIQYGLPVAISIQAMSYNASALQRLGMTLPSEFTYKSFAEFCAEIHRRNPALYGSHDEGGRLQDLTRLLVAQDRSLVEDKRLMATVDDLAEWFDYWNEMRRSGGAVPADVQAAYGFGEWQNAPTVQGKAVFSSVQSQDVKSGYQALMQDKVRMMVPPRWYAHTGCYPVASSVLVINARSSKKKEAAKAIDWFLNSEEAAVILKLISGPPASNLALAAVSQLPDLDDLDRNVLDYVKSVMPDAKQAPVLNRANRALDNLLKRLNEDVGFGRTTVKAAAQDFVTLGQSEIRRA